jgi:hypothetical protein
MKMVPEEKMKKFIRRVIMKRKTINVDVIIGRNTRMERFFVKISSLGGGELSRRDSVMKQEK